jgi:crotonobetainyl-CoA:carnitine CoA-transferase CaiB-like acyl-CoA transferase
MDLSGVRVLDLTRLLPGPYATQLLADAGANVVKVESPGRGDYARTMPPTTDDGLGRVFDAVNRGKRSVALDLTTDAGLAAFDALAREADAVVEGFAPGTAWRLRRHGPCERPPAASRRPSDSASATGDCVN